METIRKFFYKVYPIPSIFHIDIEQYTQKNAWGMPTNCSVEREFMWKSMVYCIFGLLLPIRIVQLGKFSTLSTGHHLFACGIAYLCSGELFVYIRGFTLMWHPNKPIKSNAAMQWEKSHWPQIFGPSSNMGTYRMYRERSYRHIVFEDIKRKHFESWVDRLWARVFGFSGF